MNTKPKYHNNTSMPHIGEILKAHIKKHRLPKSALARKMLRTPATIEHFLKRPSLQCAILWEICEGYKHNFFADLAAQLPPAFTTNAPDPTLPLQERIAELEEENKILAGQLELLKGVIGKK